MSPSPLAAKLQSHATLLPSQRELLERLLFQIEFNGFQHIQLVGGPGAGKTTLSLVLAELLSESMNLAYFAAQPDMTTAQCQKHLLQQWFGLSEFDGDLMEQLAQPQTQPLVWILDSQGALPLGCLSLLRAHPIHIITTGPDALAEADLNLTISAITEQEAEQLLPTQMLHTRSAAERLQAAAGNLHLLLEPEPVQQDRDSRPVAAAALHYRTASLLLALLGVLAIALFWWLRSTSEPDVPAADNQPRPLPQAWSPAVTATPLSDSEVLPDSESPDSTARLEPEQSLAEPEASLLSAPTAEAMLDEVTATTEALIAVPEPATTELHQVEQLESAQSSAMVPEPEQAAEPQQEPAATDSVVADITATSTNWQQDEAALLAMDEQHYVLQLGAYASLNAAQTVRRTYAELPMLIYQRQLNGQMQWVLVLASYPTANQARAMRAELPAALRTETPFIKPMQQVRQEISSASHAQGNSGQ